MTRATIGRTARMTVVAAAVAAIGVPPLYAQDGAQRDLPSGARWTRVAMDRIALSVRYGRHQPSGHSEIFTLIDEALAPGSESLVSRLLGADVRVDVAQRWRMRIAADAGRRTVASVSRAVPSSFAGPVAQQTRIERSIGPSVGAEWSALRWRGRGAGSLDHAQLTLGAGVGLARYRLRQWGTLVDADRGIAFTDDLQSSGHGRIAYAGVVVDVPVRRWISLTGELRRDVGSAPMAGDYATFDRIDLGGTTMGVGFTLSARSVGRAR